MKKIRFMLVALAIMALSLTCMTSCMFIPIELDVNDILGSLFGNHSGYEDCNGGDHEWIIEGYEEPYCHDEGYEYYRCIRCGEHKTDRIEQLGHEIVDEASYAPTCNSEGYAGGKYCERCGDVIESGKMIPFTGHQNTYISGAKESTCSEKGYTGDTVCSDCGEIVSSGKETNQKPHSYVTDKGYDATCTEEGLTDGSHCEVCDYVNNAQYIISVKGHSYGYDGHCSGCDGVVADCLSYTENTTGYTVSGFIDGSGNGVRILAIPESYNGRTVVDIADNAFENCTQLTNVVIPYSVIYIGENAFDGCTSLSSVKFDNLEQYNTICNSDVDWLGDRDSVKIQLNKVIRDMTPYEVYLSAMNSVNHNLNRYELVSDGITSMTYMGTTVPMVGTRMVQRQYYNDFYIYQSSTDFMSSPNTVEETALYYVNNYLYYEASAICFYCSPEAFGDLFLVESGDIPQLTERFFKNASFEIADGKMYLIIEMDQELIEALITQVAGISVDMTITSCTYSYEFDMDGNILSYTSDMVYGITGQPYTFEAVSVTYFNELGTLPAIEAPEGYTDCTDQLQNQCAGGHTVVEHDEVPSTCFGQGKSAYSYCSRCYLAIVPYEVIEPSHSYHNGECTECGRFEYEDEQ